MEYPPPSPSYMSNHAQQQYQYPQSPGPPRQPYNPQLQVILCQKHSFLYQITQNMTADCKLNYEFSTRKLQVQYMLCTSNCSEFQKKKKINLIYTTNTELIIQ